MSSLLPKFHFPVDVLLNSLQTQKGLELFFQWQFFVKYLGEDFSYVI